MSLDELNLQLASKDVEIARLKEKCESVPVVTGMDSKQVEYLNELLAEKEEALKEQSAVIVSKNEIIRDISSQIELLKSDSNVDKLRAELTEQKEQNSELLEIQRELEESINSYESKLSSLKSSTKEEISVVTDLNDIFPIVNDNCILNARKVCCIREVGENPWLEDFICYLSAMMKSKLQGTGIEPLFVILDDLSSFTRKKKYKEYDFTLNALPSFGAMPEMNIVVTNYTTIVDLKAHLNISNQEFIIFIDRYGKQKPFVSRRSLVEYNLVNNVEMVSLCNLAKDNSLIATFHAKQLVNSVEIPSDYALRGKRDRISLFLSKKAYSEVLENLESGLFK